MSIAEQLSSRAKISDPKPAYCCVCLCSSGPDVRFVDFGARRSIGAVVDPISGGLLARLDKVEICEACVREAGEVLEFVPQLHRTHLNEVRRLRAENDRLEGENKLLRSLVAQEA